MGVSGEGPRVTAKETGTQPHLAEDSHPDVSQAEIAVLAVSLETEPAAKAVAWAVERFAGAVSLACSFQDCVVVDIAVQVDPQIEVVFLDTGFHFPETLEFVEVVRSRYGLNLRVVEPGPGAETWPCGTERCCELRKVAPLAEALRGKQAWITGLKRVDAPTRVATPIVEWDRTRRMVKVNPIATWTEDDVASYVAEHALPEHPLVSRGYLSIGCAPTTRAVAPGADRRAGRWSGTDKTECGLHA